LIQETICCFQETIFLVSQAITANLSIDHHGVLAKPPTYLLKKKEFAWTAEAQCAFDELKLAMTTTPVSALLDFSKPFTMEIGACDAGLGAVFMQKGQHIAFLSRALSDKHKYLSIYEKEFLALILAVD
jgi:hypothetical protein